MACLEGRNFAIKLYPRRDRHYSLFGRVVNPDFKPAVAKFCGGRIPCERLARSSALLRRFFSPSALLLRSFRLCSATGRLLWRPTASAPCQTDGCSGGCGNRLSVFQRDLSRGRENMSSAWRTTLVSQAQIDQITPGIRLGAAVPAISRYRAMPVPGGKSGCSCGLRIWLRAVGRCLWRRLGSGWRGRGSLSPAGV